MPTKKLRQEPQPCRSFFTILLLCVFDNTVSLSAEVVEHQVLSRNAEVVEHLLNGFGHRAGTAHVVFDVFVRRSHRHSANTVKMLMNLAVVLVIVGAIGAVVFSQVQLTELTDEINTANESLSQEKSIAIQLEMQAASKLNTEEIVQIAREKLGMEKVADGQTSYISLTQDDEGTVVQAEKTPNLLDRIWQVLQSLFS